MMVTGSATQEKWLGKMGEIAHGISTEIDVIVFKGIFRLAIAEALLEHRMEAWESLERKDTETRRRFMESVLNHASGRLAGLGSEKTTIAAIDRALHDKILDHLKYLGSTSRAP